ncbi:MAG TPA: Ig-like domain-containing protein [Rhodanobacteraceae bacterium]|nr:Ig-like domain-containing protein [Rhodanobacteraceae bacterium]
MGRAANLAAPIVEKSFDNAQVFIGGIVRMKIKMKNPNASDITGVHFKDIYPPGLANAPTNVVVSNTCGGALAAPANGKFAQLSGAMIPHDNGASCEVVLNVTGTQQESPATNQVSVLSANADPSASATAILSIAAGALLGAPVATVKLLPDTLAMGGHTIIETIITNPNFFDLHSVQFTMPYPAPLTIQNHSLVALFNTCGPLSDPFGSSIAISGVSIPAGGFCVVDVSVKGIAAGTSELHTGPILSAEAAPGADVSATINVVGDPLLPAPSIAMQFVPSSMVIGGMSQLRFTFTNNDADHAVTGVAMDTFYVGANAIQNAPNALVRNTCGGSVKLRTSATDPYDVGLLGGTIPAGSSCDVVVNVVGVKAGIGTIFAAMDETSAANAVSGAFAGNAYVNVLNVPLGTAPTASMQFAPTSIDVGAKAAMTITLKNPNGVPVTGVQFSDSFPDGIANVPANDPAGVVASNTCGGTVTTDVAANALYFSDGTIPVGAGGCQLVINVVGAKGGQWVNALVAFQSGNAQPGANAISGLEVKDSSPLPAPTVSKMFSSDSVPLGGSTAMKITLTNGAQDKAITGIQFTDPYPGGLENAASDVIADNTCGGTVTAPQKGTSASLINGTLAAGQSCQIVINVVGKASGDLLNQMQPVTSINASPSASASATLHVTGVPDLTLSKTHANDFWRDETGAIYTLTVTNIGTGPTAGDVTVTETPPAGMTATAMGGSGWTCKMDTMTCTSSDTVQPGQSYPLITLMVDIDKNAPKSLTNTASVSGGGESNTANDSASDVTQIALASPTDLTLMKTHIGNFMQGQTGATYTLVVNNIGGTASNGQVTVVDTLPAGLTVTDMKGTGWMCVLATKTCTRGDPLAGATSFDPITLTVDVAANAPGTLTNTATVSGGGETNTANDTANDPTTIAPAGSFADLVLTKTHVGSFTQGQSGATYTLTASNIGGAATSGTVTVTDMLPAGLTATAMAGTGWICSVAPTPTCTNSNVVAAGASYQPITLTVDVAADATTNITNTATVSGGGETNTANDTVDDPTTITPAGGNGNHAPFATDDAIQVAPSGTTGALVGDAHQTNSVLDNDIDPDGGQLTADEPSQPSHGDLLFFNADGTFSYRNNGDQATTDSFTYKACKGQLCDTATVTITIGDGLDNHPPIAVNDAAVVAPLAMTDVLIGDAVQPSSVLDNDHDADAGDTVKVGKVGPLLHASGTVAVSPAGLFTYTNGDSTATTDTLVYEACDDHGACTPAKVTITIGDGLDDHLPDAVDDAIDVAPGDSTSALVGDAITPNSVLHNDSDVDGDGLTAVKLSDPSHGSLDLAADGTFTYDNDGSPATTDAFQYAACDSFGACEEATVAITIGGGGAAAPDLTLTKHHSGNFVRGQTGATYTIVVSNTGDAATDGSMVTVTDTLPVGLTPTTMAGANWTCNSATLTCTRSTPLAAGSSYDPITLTVDVDANAPASVTNTANVSGGGETNTANDTFDDPTAIDPVSPSADLTLTKTHVGEFTQGQTGATYTLIVSNIGGAPTSGLVTLTDTLPVGLTATAMSGGPSWNCSAATATCTRSDALVAGASYPAITLTVDVAANAPANVTNNATVSGGGETNTANDAVGDPTTIAAKSSSADLTLTKTHVGDFSQGQTGATYTLIASNIGGAPTSGVVTVTDTLPAGMTASAMSGGPNWNCTLATTSCVRSDVLASGASYAPITLTVDVAVTAPSSLTNTATVSGGGETNTANDGVSDPTTIEADAADGHHVPFAVDDAIQVDKGGTTSVLVGDPRTPNSVLDNDLDLDGDTLTAEPLTDPSHGTLLAFGADGTFTYQNTDPSATTDTFLYRACDALDCDVGIVTVTIGDAATHHLPIVVDDAIQVAPSSGTSLLIGDLLMPNSVLHNDSDPDGGLLTADKTSSLLNGSGALQFNGDGTLTYQNIDPSATTDKFLYEACDADGGCTGGTVTITITSDPHADSPPIAMDDAIVVGPNGTATTLVGDPNVPSKLTDNDSDPEDGNALTASLIAPPSEGTAIVNADATFSYTNKNPDATSDSFQYQACDSFGACTAATVSITIDPSAPTVICTLPTQVDSVGDAASIDLSSLFAAPPGKTLDYSVANPPPALSLVGSLLSGTFGASGTYTSTLRATTVPGGMSATEDVKFVVLPAGDILLRNGFDLDDPNQPVCH